MSASFAPVSALMRDLMIGAAAAILWLGGLGRIAGISGILDCALKGTETAEHA